jgi:hypothetical protein
MSEPVLWGIFHALVAGHVACGAVGLVVFWVPVIGRKGGDLHRKAGFVFAWGILATGCFAIGMSLMTLAWPMETHPHLRSHPDFRDPAAVRAVFGWMMLYLAVLTVNLCWYGLMCVRNRFDHARNAAPFNLFLQGAVTVTAALSALQGWLIGAPLLGLASIVGFATAATNLRFIANPRPSPVTWQKEHLKALVGAGISVYTAFFAFGSVRLMPSLALSPALWSVPLTAGLAIILYQWWKLDRRFAGRPRHAP